MTLYDICSSNAVAWYLSNFTSRWLWSDIYLGPKGIPKLKTETSNWCEVYKTYDGPARKPTLAVDLLLYLQLPLRMVHGKTKEKENKTKHKHKQNKTTGATNKQSRHNKNT